MQNKFCGLLTNGYSFSVNHKNLLLKPCCLYKTSSHYLNYSDSLVYRQSISDWTPACNECRILELAGQQSLRQASKDWILNDNSSDAFVVDINLDLECNAACVMCSENSSSLWAKEKNKKYLPIASIDHNNDKIDHLINEVAKINLSKLRYVKFFGGEPLFTDTHIKFLEKIPNPEQVTLHYTTNASIYPNAKVREIWKRFKVIIFAASVDGVGDRFDYIRWPLKWDKVSRNLLRIRDSDIWNVMFRVEFTANFLNVYYYNEVESWFSNKIGRAHV